MLRSGFRFHPQGGAHPLLGGVGTSRTFPPRGERADLNPEAREGVGPSPLLTAAEPAAVAGLAEGAAGAAHRGDATTGSSAAGGRVQPPVPAPRGVGPGAWIPVTAPQPQKFLGFCEPSSRRCGAQPHSGARGQGEPLRRKWVRAPGVETLPRGVPEARERGSKRGQDQEARRGEGGRRGKGREEKGL